MHPTQPTSPEQSARFECVLKTRVSTTRVLSFENARFEAAKHLRHSFEAFNEGKNQNGSEMRLAWIRVGSIRRAGIVDKEAIVLLFLRPIV